MPYPTKRFQLEQTNPALLDGVLARRRIFHDQPTGGSASKLRPLSLGLAVIAPVAGPSEEPSSGNWPAPNGASYMSHDLSLAQSHAFQLSRDLMVPVTVFEVDGEYGVLPSDEIDADDDLEIVHEFFPWAAH